jgi:REP element-mobilizing transposase RayT
MANKRISPYRESVRLQDCDYSKGIYVVTICTKDRECFFCDIINRKMELNDMGKKAEELWTEIPNKFEDIKLDAFVVMPNHVHGIIIIGNYWEYVRRVVRDASQSSIYLS